MRTASLLLLLLVACTRPQLHLLALPTSCSGHARLPMTISVDSSAEPYRGSLVVAVAAWESATGLDLFTWQEDGTVTADVLVIARSIPGPRGGQAPVKCQNGPGISLELDVGLDTYTATAMGQHELGHVLGLGHSEVHHSIMYPRVDGSLMGDWDDETYQRILSTDAMTVRHIHSAW